MEMHFSEILVILLVALLVIKPERLPDVAYKLGSFIKWARQKTATIKAELEAPVNKTSSSQHD